MIITKTFEDIINNNDLMEALIVVYRKRNGIIGEENRKVVMLGNGAKITVPRKYVGCDANVYFTKTDKQLEQDFKKEMKELVPGVIPVPMTDKELEREERIVELELKQKELSKQ